MIGKLLRDYGKTYPDGDVDERYALEYAQAAWTSYTLGTAGITESYRSSWPILRAYGAGNQPASIYNSWMKNTKQIAGSIASEYDLDKKVVQNYMRSGMKSVDSTPISFIPKIKSIIKGALMDADYSVKAHAIDAFSRASEEEKKWETWVRNREKEFIEYAQGLLGIEATEDVKPVDDMVELEILSSMDGFKTQWAIVMEKLTRLVHDQSDYRELKDMWIDDLLDGRLAVAKDEIVDGFVRYKYINPEYFICQYSERSDYSDIQWAAHLEYVSLVDIAKKIGVERANEVKNTYGDILRAQSGQGSRSVKSNDTLEALSGKVVVMNLSFISNMYEYYRVYQWSGKKRYKKLNKNDISSYDGVEVNTIPMLYEVKWVVGTDVVYDFGTVYNQPRSRDGRVRLNYHIYSLPSVSLVQQLIPLEDEYMKGWIMYQIGVNNGIKSGIALNTSMLKNVSINGQSADPIQIIDFYKEERVMPYSQSPTGEYKGGAVTPIVPIQGITDIVINESIRRKQYVSETVVDVIGFNPFTVSNQPSAQGSVASEINAEALTYVMKPLLNAILNIKTSVSKNCVMRIQNLVAYDKNFEKRYSGVLSASEVHAIKVAEMNNVEYMITLRPKASRDDIYQFLNTVQDAYRMQMLTPQDYLFIIEQINNDVELSKIRQYVAYRHTKMQEAMAKQQMQAIQMQNEAAKSENDDRMNRQIALMEKRIEGKMLEIQQKNEGLMSREREVTNREIEKIVRKLMAQ